MRPSGGRAPRAAPCYHGEDGRRVNGVRLNPQAVTVRIDIERKLNYREVAVRARTTGHPSRGYFISSVEVEPSTVTVVGPPAAIAEMTGLVATKGPVDVSGATRMLAERLELELPEGVSVLAEGGRDPQTVLVTVGIDAVAGGTTVEVPLQTRKLGDGLTAKLSVQSVDVILTGPAVLLDNLGLIGDRERGKGLCHLQRWIIPLGMFALLCAVMAAIGMFPGVPALLESFRGLGE